MSMSIAEWSLAELTAAGRAAEAERGDPLFVDALARRFVTPVGRHLLSELGGDALVGRLAVRTKWFDDQVLTFAGRASQIVTLGAGFDARWARLAMPNTSWLEIDRPSVLGRKLQLLGSQPEGVVALGLDVGGELAPLTEYLSDGPRCWVLEGFLPYLSREQAEQLLRQLSARVRPCDGLFYDVPNLATLASAAQNSIIERARDYGWVLRWGTDDPAAHLNPGVSASVRLLGNGAVDAARLGSARPSSASSWLVAVRSSVGLAV